MIAFSRVLFELDAEAVSLEDPPEPLEEEPLEPSEEPEVPPVTGKVERTWAASWL